MFHEKLSNLTGLRFVISDIMARLRNSDSKKFVLAVKREGSGILECEVSRI
jgi:hypothetical protein